MTARASDLRHEVGRAQVSVRHAPQSHVCFSRSLLSPLALSPQDRATTCEGYLFHRNFIFTSSTVEPRVGDRAGPPARPRGRRPEDREAQPFQDHPPQNSTCYVISSRSPSSASRALTVRALTVLATARALAFALGARLPPAPRTRRTPLRGLCSLLSCPLPLLLLRLLLPPPIALAHALLVRDSQGIVAGVEREARIVRAPFSVKLPTVRAR